MVAIIVLIRIRNPLLHDKLVLRILKNLLRSLIRRKICIRPRDHQGRAILHGLRESNKRITGRDDRRNSRRSTLGLRCTRKSNSFLKSRDLGLTNSLILGTLLTKTRLM
ncbi:hypothetical protein ACJW31_09G114800 [Castanea mollissima]